MNNGRFLPLDIQVAGDIFPDGRLVLSLNPWVLEALEPIGQKMGLPGAVFIQEVGHQTLEQFSDTFEEIANRYHGGEVTQFTEKVELKFDLVEVANRRKRIADLRKAGFGYFFNDR